MQTRRAALAENLLCEWLDAGPTRALIFVSHSLPGMMTGQILAGASPGVAVRYQIVIMFVLAASSALGSLGAVLLAYRALLDSRDRLRGGRLRK